MQSREQRDRNKSANTQRERERERDVEVTDSVFGMKSVHGVCMSLTGRYQGICVGNGICGTRTRNFPLTEEGVEAPEKGLWVTGNHCVWLIETLS